MPWYSSSADAPRLDGPPRTTGIAMAHDASDAERLEELERSLMRPEVRASAPALDRLLAPDFFEFGGSGRVYDRREIIEALTGERGAASLESGARDFEARPLAEGVALLTYRTRRRDPEGGEPYDVLRSSIWKRTDGRWRIVFHQATPARAPSGPRA